MSQSQEGKPLNRNKAIETLWRRGIIHWKLDKNQMEMRKLVFDSNHKVTVIGSSRQLGKSFAMTTLAIEQCIKQPHSIVKFIAPKVKDIRRIIAPLIREITSDCPTDMRPTFKTQESVFRFPNGSEIQLAGTDNGHAESIRGNKAHLCIIDEAGFCDDLNYIVNSILIPTTTTTNGKIVMASTPPKSPDHDFMGFLRAAEFEGRFLKRTIYDNPRLSAEDIDRLAEALGGKESVDFRREYLVEIITSEDDAVVPEFTKSLQEKIVKEWPRPAYFDAYVSMDIGVRDMTVVLFAYYDFQNAKVIFEDELVFRGNKVLTDDLAYSIKEKEKLLWTNKYSGEVKKPALRVSDNNNLILLNDLQVKHDLGFLPTLKDNKDAALNNMRMLLRTEKVIINPKCKTLIMHLESAIWDKSRTKYARSVDKGHYDAVDAASYMLRNINMNKNPFPTNYNFSPGDVLFQREYNKDKASNDFEKSLVGLMDKRTIRKIKRK